MTGQYEWDRSRWRGRWIWHEVADLRRPGLVSSPGGEGNPATWVLLRRVFDLTDVPDTAPARLTADSRYALHVNGTELARGPIRSHPSRLHYDEVDLAPAMRKGPNVITAVVRFYGKPTPWWMPAVPTRHLGAGGFLFEARIGDDWLVSDDSWKVVRSDAWSDGVAPGIGGPPEILDARRLPHRWVEPNFDDGEWAHAAVLPANHFGFDGDQHAPTLPYGALPPRPIAQLDGEQRYPDEPMPQQVAVGVHTYLFDFGQVVSGGVVLEVDSEPGAKFEIAISEGMETVVGLAETADVIEFVAPGGSARFESFDSFGFQFLHITTACEAPAAITSVSVKERLHPRGEGPYFSCSDPLLNQIWNVGRRTLDICSHDAYLDCPTREQRAWVGDAATSQAVDLVSNSNWDLARWNIEFLASPRSDGMLPMAVGGDFEHLDFTYIPDFACRWINALNTLRRYTGDRELVGRLLPVAENILRWFANFQEPDGLLGGVNGWVFIDWAAVSTAGRSAALNGLWGRALLDFTEISDWVGDKGRASWARGLHTKLNEGFEQFWDIDRQLYVDHIFGGEPQPPTSQHSQAAAVVGGLVSENRLAAVALHLVDSDRLVDTYWGDQPIGGPPLTEGPPAPTWDVHGQMVKAQPGFRSIIHDALVMAGGAALLPAQCRQWKVMLERCPTSFSETWTAGTVSHAWSTTPTRDLIIYTAGISPAEPRFTTVRIAPCRGDLEWVRAATPTPAGLVSVEINSTEVVIDSPVPVLFDPSMLWGGECIRLAAGKHHLKAS